MPPPSNSAESRGMVAKIAALEREIVELRKIAADQAAVLANRNAVLSSAVDTLCSMSQSLSSMYCNNLRPPPHVAVCISGIARAFVRPLVYRSFKEHVLNSIGGAVTGFARVKLGDAGYLRGDDAHDTAAEDVLRILAFVGIPAERAILVNDSAPTYADCTAGFTNAVEFAACIDSKGSGWCSGRIQQCRSSEYVTERCRRTCNSTGPKCAKVTASTMFYSTDRGGQPTDGTTVQTHNANPYCKLSYLSAAIGQLESRYEGMRMVEQYETHRGIRFDWVLFARPDLLWYRPLRPWCFFSRNRTLPKPIANADFAFLLPRDKAVPVLQAPFVRYRSCEEDFPRCKSLEHYQRGVWRRHGLYPIEQHATGLPALIARPRSSWNVGPYTCRNYMHVAEQKPWEPDLLQHSECSAVTNWNKCMLLAAS